jgi:hypothetical protein
VESGSPTGSTLLVLKRVWPSLRRRQPLRDPLRGQCQAGSLTGAVHLSKGNAGVLRIAQRGQKPRVEQKGKCYLDPDFQYEYGPRKRGLSILLSVKSFKQEVSEKLPQG